MLIVISDPVVRADEAGLINELFDAGMTVLHLRKPEAEASDIQQILEGIQPEYRHLIALHSHHQLAKAYGINRLHFTEQNRAETGAATLEKLIADGFYLSASMHRITEIEAFGHHFNYVFFGPVFNSISKKGYLSALPPDFKVPASTTKVIALGGIDAQNCTKAIKMGFDGIAVLGAIWQDKDPVKAFEQIRLALSTNN